MSTDPAYVTNDQVRAAYDALGLDPDVYNDVRTIVIRHDAVTVTRGRRSDEGRYVLAAGTWATETVIVGVRDDTPADVQAAKGDGK